MKYPRQIYVVDYGPNDAPFTIGQIVSIVNTIAEAEQFLTDNPRNLPDIESGRYSIDGTPDAWYEQTGERG